MKKFLLIYMYLFLTGTASAQSDLIAPELTAETLIDYLQDNYSVSNPLGYNGARDAMYGSIDNTDGQVTCVYTGFTVTASTRGDAFDLGINTEHTWPQSLFDKDEPMKGDIHHLFPTRIEANSGRNNFPFDEIPDQLTDTWYFNNTQQSGIPTSNIDLYSELDAGTAFEPREDHKGNVARAIFYFWTIYQNTNDVSDDADFFEGMKDVLLDWHSLDPVDDAEVQRSLGAEQAQGNKNPFVHDTTLVRRAYFGAGPIQTSGEEETEAPSVLQLSQNYPNPFNPETRISYIIKSSGLVKLEVFNMLGQKVAVLVNRGQLPGNYTVTFNGKQIPSGIYLYRLKTVNGTYTKRMSLVK